jgi:hypothetical protein
MHRHVRAPRRLTWIGGSADAVGWTREGQLLYGCRRRHRRRRWKGSRVKPHAPIPRRHGPEDPEARPGTSEAVLVTSDYNGTSKAPMIWQNRVYFLSDRDGTMNLWWMAFDGSDARQLTHHDDYEAQSPSLSAGRIAYQHGASSSRRPTGAGPR